MKSNKAGRLCTIKRHQQLMRRIYFTILLVGVFFAIGCNNNTCYRQLEQVDSLTENDLTDSALYILNKVGNNCAIKEGKEKAYYNLLRYQLLFRAGYSNINDSLINYSIAYYTEHSDNRKLALSYYLKGRFHEDINKEAIMYLKKAEFFARKTENSFLMMRILNSIAMINVKNEDYSTGLIYEIEAIEHGEKTNATETLSRCYMNLSTIYGNLHQNDSSAHYAYKSLEFLNRVPLELKKIIYLNLATTLINNDTVKAREYALKSLEIQPTNNAYQILAKLARDKNDYELSEKYLTEALKYSPSVDWEAFIVQELAQTKEMLGKHKEAHELSQKVIILRDSVEHIHARDSIKEIQLAADLENKAKAMMEEKDSLWNAITAILGSVIILAIIYYIYKRHRHKKAVAAIEETMNEQATQYEKKVKTYDKQIETYRQDIRKKEEENREKDKAITKAQRTLQRQQENMKAELAKQQMIDAKLIQAGALIYEKLTAKDTSVAWNNDTMKSLVAFYRTIAPEFMIYTDTQYADITTSLQAMLILKNIGLTTKEMAAITHTTESSVRARLSRANKKALTQPQ